MTSNVNPTWSVVSLTAISTRSPAESRTTQDIVLAEFDDPEKSESSANSQLFPPPLHTTEPCGQSPEF